jgi:uncharacterized protein YyaL (SSP411 family)
LAASRTKLLAVRGQRVRPGRDEKVLVNWNGLAIDAMARAGAALGEPRYTDAARRAANFILQQMSPTLGRLLHVWCAGRATLNAYLDDYTALANGLVSLYEATFDERYLEVSASLLDTVLEKFFDADQGAFFYTADDHEALIARTVELTDNATPSGASLAATALLRLGKLTGNAAYLESADRTLRASASMIQRVPIAMGQMLLALDLQVGPTPELVMVGDQQARQVADSIHGRFIPRRVLAYRSTAEEGLPLLAGAFTGRTAVGGEPTLYVCENGTCQAPAEGAAAITNTLDALEKP